jgi:adenosylcobinamide-phosphate synthase
MDELGSLAGSLRRRFDAGDPTSGWLALVAWVAIATIPMAVLHFAWLANQLLLSFLVQSALLYVVLDFWPTSDRLMTATMGAAKRARPAPEEDRAVARHAVGRLHHEVIAPVLWYALLPGPLGILFYIAVRGAALYWRASGSFGEPAATLFRWIDWLPQRLSGLIFAVMGNFEDALYAWRSARSQAAQESAEEVPSLVLAAAAGAVGRTLTAPSEAGDPALENMNAEGLQAIAALAWRSVAVLLVLLLLFGVGRVL